MPKRPVRSASILFIFVTIVLDMIGMGLVIPIMPNVIRRLTSDPTLVSTYFGYFVSLYAAMQFLAAPLLGALSDLWGRKPILLLSLLASGLNYIVMAYSPSLELLFVGRIIAGLTAANITVAMAYIADVSTDQNRSANFGMMGAAFGLGFIVGPALGGLLGKVDPLLPFMVAAGLSLLNFLFGWLILPESLPPQSRTPFSPNKINPFASLLRMFRSPILLALLGVHFLNQLAGQTHPSIWVLYSQQRYGWGPTEVGLSLSLVGVLSALVQGGLTRILVPRLGERRTVLMGTLGAGIAFLLFALANQGWMAIGILVGSAVFWISTPALQSLITGSAPSREQGELQGTFVSLTSLASILNPLITTRLFATGVAGAPYYFAAAASGLAFVVASATHPRSKKSST